MFELTVVDHTYPENTFSENSRFRFVLLQVLKRIYGSENISQEFESLVKGELVTIWPDNGTHKVTVKLTRTSD